MTPSRLKFNVEATGSHFFSRDTMSFFGDTMKNYGCRSAVHNGILCWELTRKRPVNNDIKDSAFFDKSTFERVL